jgi:hypothetical protein
MKIYKAIKISMDGKGHTTDNVAMKDSLNHINGNDYI